MNYLKAQLTPQKQRAAELVVDNEFMTAADGKRMTNDELAAEIGITRMTLYLWKKEPDFLAYMQQISDKRLAQHRAKADAMLLKLIDGTSNNGIGSIKALELYYKLEGRLVQRAEVTNIDGNKPQLTQEEISAGIDELAAKLKQGG